MSEQVEIGFSLNGVPHTVHTSPDRSVMDVLRLDLGITTIKPGCSPQGVCGCCALLINGKPRLSCTLKVKTIAGKELLTQDGLSEAESVIYQRAFAESGGTQCGYCTPGIVMATKALLDREPAPSDTQISKALQMHICRCTGWVKIHDAIHLAAKMRRDGGLAADAADGVGSDWRQRSIHKAVVGHRPYIDDMTRDGMLHGVIVWTPFARCLVNKVDTVAASAMPGVVRIATAIDAPGDRKVGLIFRDWPILIADGEETRCCADMLAIVTAETPEQARAAAEAVRLDVTELKPMVDLVEASKISANVLATSTVVKGDAAAAFGAGMAHVAEDVFETQVIDQAFLEPEASLVEPEADGGYRVYSCGQGVFDDQLQLCALFELPPEKLRIVLVPTGGGFGAKEDLNVQPQALLMAMLTGRPVKIALNMAESTRFHPKRHPFRMHYKVGCDQDGMLLAVQARILGDTGGYASVGDKVLERGAGHACGPYVVPNVDVVAHTIYTNNPVNGAMRGFGVNQVAFALEGCLERLADAVGMDALEFRAQNLLRPGLQFSTGQVMNEGCGIVQTMDAIRPLYAAAKAAGKHVGLACGIKNVGMGNGLTEIGRVELEVMSADEIRLYTGFTEMGQGHDTVMAQMASEAMGLPAKIFTVICTTEKAVETGMTTASRATYLGGNAIIAVSGAFNDALAAQDGDLGALIGRKFKGQWQAPDTNKPEDVTDTPVTHYAFGFATQMAIVDSEGRLEELVAAHDVGRAINRKSCEGQVEGGVHMGIGYALSEELMIDDQGMPDMRYRSLGIIKDKHMPKITTLIIEHPDPSGPWGAKGIGEIGLVPTAPAIAAAIRRFDGKERTVLPMKDTEAAKAMGVRPRKR
jgi:xanthine dehydrogenase molybdenum-binding subunit